MSAKTTISATECRKNFFDIIKEVQNPGVYYTLTEKGKSKAVIISAEEFESWQETLEVMQDFPNLKKDIERADNAIKTGEYKKWPSLEDIMNKYGYVLADGDKNKYGMGNKTGKRSAKRAK